MEGVSDVSEDESFMDGSGSEIFNTQEVEEAKSSAASGTNADPLQKWTYSEVEIVKTFCIENPDAATNLESARDQINALVEQLGFFSGKSGPQK
jgi:hypothetical protein